MIKNKSECVWRCHLALNFSKEEQKEYNLQVMLDKVNLQMEKLLSKIIYRRVWVTQNGYANYLIQKNNTSTKMQMLQVLNYYLVKLRETQ